MHVFEAAMRASDCHAAGHLYMNVTASDWLRTTQAHRQLVLRPILPMREYDQGHSTVCKEVSRADAFESRAARAFLKRRIGEACACGEEASTSPSFSRGSFLRCLRLSRCPSGPAQAMNLGTEARYSITALLRSRIPVKAVTTQSCDERLVCLAPVPM